MTPYRHIGDSVRQAHALGGRAGRAIERAAEASARNAAADALVLARDALAADNLADCLGLLSRAGLEALQALEVGWEWAIPERGDRRRA